MSPIKTMLGDVGKHCKKYNHRSFMLRPRHNKINNKHLYLGYRFGRATESH